MKRVLVTGADGMLATDLIRSMKIKDGYKVLACNKQTLDITNREAVRNVISRWKPNIVIHTAAITNVDYCEHDEHEAFKVNGYGTENMAFYAEKINAKFVYISSCGLFGDEMREYAEHDPVVLKTAYARSKYFGEVKTKEWSSQYFIVRPGWLFGGSIKHKKNFVFNRYKEALEKEEMISATDKYGTPTYTFDLAHKIMELVETDYYGTYHITNQGYGSRYDYVKKILDGFGLTTKVKPVDSTFFKRSAPVPNSEMLKNDNLTVKGLGLLPNWKESLEKYIESITKA